MPISRIDYSFSMQLVRIGHMELEQVQLTSLVRARRVARNETILMRTTTFTWTVTRGSSGGQVDLKSRAELGMLKGQAELDMLRGRVELSMLKSRAELGMMRGRNELGMLKGRAELGMLKGRVDLSMLKGRA